MIKMIVGNIILLILFEYSKSCLNQIHYFYKNQACCQGRNRRGAGWQFPKGPHLSAISRGPHHLIKKHFLRFFIFTQTDCKNTRTSTHGAHYLSHTHTHTTTTTTTHTHTHTDIDTRRHTHKYSRTKKFSQSDTVKIL